MGRRSPASARRPRSMPRLPKVVSVLMGAYRAEKWIVRALRTSLCQELPPGWELEVLVGVDACPATLRAVRTLEDPRLGVVVLEKNVGTYVAANTLLSISRGSLVSRADADDEMLPGRLYEMIQYLEAHSDVGMVGTWAIEADVDMRHHRSIRACPDGVWMYRRGVLEKLLGGFRPWRCAADSEAVLRARYLGVKRGVIPKHLYLRREHPAQLTAAQGTGHSSPLRMQLAQTMAQEEKTYRAGKRPPQLRLALGQVRSREGGLFDYGRPNRRPLIQQARPRLSIAVLMPTLPTRRSTAVDVVESFLQQDVQSITVFLNGHSRLDILVPDTRVQYVLKPPKTGPLVRYREGRRASGHDVVFLVDDDVVYPPDYIARTTGHLESLGRGHAVVYHGTGWGPSSGAYADRHLTHARSANAQYLEYDYAGSGSAAFWGEDFERLTGLIPAYFEYEDDAWMSSKLRSLGVRLVRPPTERDWILPLSTGDDGLYHLATQDRYRKRDQVIRQAEQLHQWVRRPARPYKKEKL